ncbi:very short patch repair endonuclease [Bradyrhizobium vignae]|uniref:DNA mismatch endonuclease Vsr n=1 Tax=Bradyrhizobium vignae TaxID=1549949 RepID=A0ABS4A1U5_9BRAD|nr:very short patch repair endonuclease [Bradyrhizobium vignae]MBP0114363.1 DNA mismatch endonuclease Vsr [Bradyrhizobium vignae]
MVDVVPPDVRSRMMSGIRGKNTKPEMLLRQGLHRAGFRYKLHDRSLPGRPDMVFPRRHAVLFAHGCFWHGHNCHLFKWPATREVFWKTKIARNREVDARAEKALKAAGWRRAIVWECALRGKSRMPIEDVFGRLADWLASDSDRIELPPPGKVI